jgi:hypothetical protein
VKSGTRTLINVQSRRDHYASLPKARATLKAKAEAERAQS